MTFKRVGYIIGILALVSSGVYVFVYLYRWEWNRALMAGVIMISAEIGLAAAVILERIKSIERRLADQQKDDHEKTVSALRDTAPERDAFRWLKQGDAGVFVPFLMGAGVLASGIAWAVERIAGATAKPTMERGLALRLGVLAMPEGGFVAETTGPIRLTPLPSSQIAEDCARPTVRRQLAALALTVLAGTIGLDLLADATKTRPDVLVAGTASNLVVEVDTHNTGQSAGNVIGSLWGACQGTVPNRLTDRGIRSLGGGRFQLEVEPALGSNGMRRLKGCLEDAVLDNVQAAVISIR